MTSQCFELIHQRQMMECSIALCALGGENPTTYALSRFSLELVVGTGLGRGGRLRGSCVTRLLEGSEFGSRLGSLAACLLQ